MINKLFIIAFIVALVASCNKDKEASKWANTEELLLPQESFDYFFVDTGSYWVYTETSTFAKDSNWCTGSITSIDSLTFSDGSPAGIWESFFVEVENTNGDEITYWTRGNDSTEASKNLNKWVINTGPTTRTIAAILPFQQDLSGSNVGSSGTTSCDTILDTLIVPAGTFTNVLRYYDAINDTEEGSQPTYYYVAESVGIIKKELITTSEVWELTNYLINQP